MAHKAEKKPLEKEPAVVNALMTEKPPAEKKPNSGKKRRCRQEVAKGEEHRNLQDLHLQVGMEIAYGEMVSVGGLSTDVNKKLSVVIANKLEAKFCSNITILP
ncbi:hypothetical protein ACS0TY_003151 [Phlomoides rotata]